MKSIGEILQKREYKHLVDTSEKPQRRAILLALDKRGESLLRVHGDVWFHNLDGTITSKYGVTINVKPHLVIHKVYTPNRMLYSKETWSWSAYAKSFTRLQA